MIKTFVFRSRQMNSKGWEDMYKNQTREELIMGKFEKHLKEEIDRQRNYSMSFEEFCKDVLKITLPIKAECISDNFDRGMRKESDWERGLNKGLENFKNFVPQTKKEGQMKVEAYTQHHAKYVFKARDIKHAREIANRIITEGLWVTDDEGAVSGEELFFPVHQVFKVKIIK